MLQATGALRAEVQRRISSTDSPDQCVRLARAPKVASLGQHSIRCWTTDQPAIYNGDCEAVIDPTS
jgi:hypothetical protein